MCVTRINLDLMMTASLHSHLWWTSDGSRVNWDEFVHYQRRANSAYAEAMLQFSVRSRDVLMNAKCPYKWLSTVKSAVFGSS